MTDPKQTLGIIAVVALCTFLTRVLPFVVFRKHQQLPPYLKYLGDILPLSVIAILVVYCLKGVSLSSVSGIIPSLVAVFVVVCMHVWKRNNLLSIGAGTLVYMLLIQLAA